MRTPVDVDRLLLPLRIAGERAYLGEPVTVLEHSLQAAALAEDDGAASETVAAALLHDLGWLLHGGPRAHEQRGAAHLEHYFGPEVVEPVRLHVEAKRYLTTAEVGYRARLSEASVRTLALQGGPMDETEIETFLDRPFSGDAVTLRRLDDRAKVPGARTPALDHYAPLLERLLVSSR